MNSKQIKNIFFIIIYIYAFYNFFAEFIFAGLGQTRSIIFLSLDAIFLILGIISLRLKSDKIYFTLFVVITILSQIFNQYYDPIQYLNGFRDFIPIFCAPFVIKYLLNQQEISIINSFNKFLKLFLLLQIPVAIMQYKEYGPGDYVGGTLGEGASGTLSLLIYFATFYLFRFENLSFSLKNIKKLVFIFLTWIPTFINETKISFLLLTIFFIFQLRLSKGQLFKSVALVLIFLPLMFLSLQKIYNMNERVNTSRFDKDYVSNYLFGDERKRNKEYVDLPRFLRLELGIKALSKDNYSLILGKGLGQFKGGTTLDKTEFAKQNEDIMSGSIIYLFFVLMQLGIFGLILILVYFSSYLYSNFSFMDNSAAIFYFIITLIAILYGSQFKDSFFTITYFFIIIIIKKFRNIVRQANYSTSHLLDKSHM